MADRGARFTPQSSVRASRYWKVWVAFVDATLIVFGLWWLHERMLAWVPSSVMFVVLTVVWLGEFLTEAFDD